MVEHAVLYSTASRADCAVRSLCGQAVHVVFNATSLKEPTLLSAACGFGLVDAMQRAVALAHAAGGMDGLCLACATLTNLAEGCNEGCEHFVRTAEAVALTRALVHGSTASTASMPVDVRHEDQTGGPP